MGISDLSTLESGAYVEPMDLYDSIFWGSYNPLRLLSGT